jgi:site-specific DNA recombinase
MKQPDAMRALAYCRVSTDAQERDGTSLVTQERACSEYARSMGWTVVDAISETASGYSLDRPGMARVRQLLVQGTIDVVVAYAVDRLSRNQNQIGVVFDEVERAGAKLDFVTEKFEDTAVGRFILAARAFGAEVEREKILERTTRGKLERARSGRIPQAMARGTFGYTYNPQTGKREIELDQADVLRRIFWRFAEARSFGAVSRELNDDGIPALGGGRWYPLTIRRILMNESYTGRFMFGRTQWVHTRSKQGRPRRKAVARPPEEWIEIPDASPQIIDDWTWNRVQAILNDPGRTVPRPKHHSYVLTGRIKCEACGSAMVGRTMTTGSYRAQYYGCTHSWNPTTKDRCGSRLVRLDRLESAIWDEIERVLTDPEVVLRELHARSADEGDSGERMRIEREIAKLGEREKRLVRLFTYGEIDEQFIRDEGSLLKKQRQGLEERLRCLQPRTPQLLDDFKPDGLKIACSAIRDWLARATDDDRREVLEALQISIVATRESAVLNGVLPMAKPQTLFTLTRASA